MCGIVGVISKNKNGFLSADVNIFSQLLLCNQLRGVDGTGIFFNDNKGKTAVRKFLGKASDVVYSAPYDLMEKNLVKFSTFVIGHNRAATKGGLTLANTHPFKHGTITGVHNGTLYNHKSMADVENDSEAIYINIANKGIQDTVNTMFGAYALVWHNKKDGTINVLRNKERPLHIIETAFNYIICSELGMGEWIALRNKETIIDKFLIEEHMMGSFSLKNLTWSWKKVEKEIKYYTPPAKNTNIIPFVNKDSSEKKAIIGETVMFTPHLVVRNGSTVYLDGFLGEDYDFAEVRYYGRNKSIELEFLSSAETLCGRVLQIAEHSSGDIKYYVLTDVVETIVSANGLILTPKIISTISHKCKMCEGYMSLRSDTIKLCSVVREGDKHSIYCVDCTEYRNRQYYNQGGEYVQ